VIWPEMLCRPGDDDAGTARAPRHRYLSPCDAFPRRPSSSSADTIVVHASAATGLVGCAIGRSRPQCGPGCAPPAACTAIGVIDQNLLPPHCSSDLTLHCGQLERCGLFCGFSCRSMCLCLGIPMHAWRQSSITMHAARPVVQKWHFFE
jgi:hypothetical protein